MRGTLPCFLLLPFLLGTRGCGLPFPGCGGSRSGCGLVLLRLLAAGVDHVPHPLLLIERESGPGDAEPTVGERLLQAQRGGDRSGRRHTRVQVHGGCLCVDRRSTVGRRRDRRHLSRDGARDVRRVEAAMRVIASSLACSTSG